jgi:hypothetical protein
METTKSGVASFIPIPDLEKLQVGHAGLYVDEAVDVDEAVESDNRTITFTRDIPLGLAGAGKTLITCEKGIKAFVKEIAKEKNHLPNSELGVWIYYLTRGILDDFSRTWEQTPYSLQEKKTSIEKSKEQGKRVLSKKEKNELVAKIDLLYYENDISSGKITFEEAQKLAKEAYDKKQELENAGYFISKNKTEGVSLFDWKKEIGEATGNPDAYKLYTKNAVEVVIPNIADNYFLQDKKPKKLTNELLKSELAMVASQFTGREDMEYVGLQINGNSDICAHIEANEKYKNALSKAKEIKGIHLVKIKKPGFMKPRYICIETTNHKDEQMLLLFGNDGVFIFHFPNDYLEKIKLSKL